ncbi:MAG TPA: uroporphyrinogen-III C-methyltransferase [Gemmatimonadales bacterium]
MSVSVVLAAHGGGDGSPANALVRWHAAQLARRRRFREVVAAFHQGCPSFETVLPALGARRVVVVPCFTSTGYYTEQVLPRALERGRVPGRTSVHITPPIGAEPALVALMATAARRVAGRRPSDTSGVLVVGHGTPRHPGSGNTTYQLAERLGRRLALPAACAFLDQRPRLETVAASLAWDEIVVVPFFIGHGEHERTDLPRRLRTVVTGDRLRFLPPVGRLPGMTALLEQLAVRHTPPSAHRVPPVRGGRVVLVGAGPGDPGLLTLRGRDALACADVVVHDRLVAPEVVELAPAGARRINVGRAPDTERRLAQPDINALLVRHATEGRFVVRLKGGDPFLFGRGAEEVDACRAAGVPCEVIPGVTSAFAVPTAAGIPVTLRGISRSVAVVTGRGARGEDLPFDARAVAGLDTIVVLMGWAALPRIVEALLAAGRDPAMPAACIQDGGTPAQRVVRGTLATIAERVEQEGLVAPVITVIGAVADACCSMASLFRPVTRETAGRRARDVR